MKTTFTLLIFSFLFYINAHATVWKVGPSRTYTKPSAVSNLVQDGDIVEIDPGTYYQDVAKWAKNNLVLRGVGGRPHLDAGGKAYGRKAIWVISGNNTTVENIEFSNCADPSENDKNWAGIRQEGAGLHVKNCYFHHNDNGILAGANKTSDIVIEFSEFAYNGFGDGYSHNLYIGHVKSLVFSYNYSHHAKVGQELKSRAYKNYILYNRIGNESDGTASREIDLPNGGLAIIIGNQIQQGNQTSNSNLIGFGLEGLSNPGPHELYLINNTLVNDKPGKGSFVQLEPGTEKFKVCNNIFAGFGSVLSGSATKTEMNNNNVFPNVAEAGFVNRKEFDYHLTSTSPAINKGIEPGVTSDGYDLKPTNEYVHPRNKKTRVIHESIDVGAFEYNIPVSSDRKVNSTFEAGFDVKAYPNPFKDRVQFNIESTVSGKGSLVVYNLLGKKVTTVFEGDIYTGSKQIVDFTLSTLDQSNYIYKFTLNGKQIVGKLINLY